MPMLLWRSVVTPVSAESTFGTCLGSAHRVDEKSMPRWSATLVDATVAIGAETW